MTSEITSKPGLQTADQGGIAGGAATQKSKDENLKLAQQFKDLAEKVVIIPEDPNVGQGEILVPSPGGNADLLGPFVREFEIVDGWLVRVPREPVVVTAPDEGGSAS